MMDGGADEYGTMTYDTTNSAVASLKFDADLRESKMRDGVKGVTKVSIESFLASSVRHEEVLTLSWLTPILFFTAHGMHGRWT